MNKPMVLVIHGMGTHKPGETKKAIADGLNEAAKNFGLVDFDINNEVEFFQFNYSDYLDEIRLKDAEKAGELVKHLSVLQGLGLGEQAVSALTSFFADFDEDEQFYTHWMDVIYYGLMYWGENIRVDLAKKINELMLERELGNRKLHIISHSLGTAVLHDTLAKLFRKDADISAKVPQLDVDRFQIDSIWMVANVSRLLNLLNDIADPNHSVVTSDIGGCTDLLFNVRNEFDPFTWFKQYKRPIENGGRQIKVNTIRELNTHDLQQYMAAPDVADALFANLLDIPAISDTQYQQGVAKHALTSINYNYAQLEDAVNDLSDNDEPQDKVQAIVSVAKALNSFQKTLKEIVDEA
ncbi:hypothetical protein [Shewanella youngdeokensis]|uniref:Alpha/beta hydrolase n=1 Tax=Shewanella youngdeokensis TaxID=2999068 RepID=A0ABZ0JWN9_9GAMM|nr:hypothetical protein RGE70_15610 [Shewanella sp. DAU334]